MTSNELLARVVPAGDCLEWTGAKTNGYGVICHSGRMMRAHRLAYQLMVGPIPDGLHIDHLCRNRACVNPDHLEPVTQAENNRRAGEAHTHCPRNHQLPPRQGAGRRKQCPTCKSEYDRARWAARKGKTT